MPGSPSLPRCFSTARTCVPTTRRRAQKGGSLHALGRSRGGWGTKACAVCDAQGRPLGFALIPGQASELRAAPDLLLLVAWLGTVRRVVCDAAYSSAAWFALVMEAGALPVVRANPTHPQPKHFNRAAYRRRTRSKTYGPSSRSGAPSPTRYDKTAKSFERRPLSRRRLPMAFLTGPKFSSLPLSYRDHLTICSKLHGRGSIDQRSP